MALDERYSQTILGINDENLKVLENQLDCQIHVRGTDVTLIGVAHEVARALKVLQELQAIARRGHVISPDSVKNAIRIVTGETPPISFESISEQHYCAAGQSSTAENPGAARLC